jgi:hypothetical protein
MPINISEELKKIAEFSHQSPQISPEKQCTDEELKKLICLFLNKHKQMTKRKLLTAVYQHGCKTAIRLEKVINELKEENIVFQTGDGEKSIGASGPITYHMFLK